MCIRDRSKLVGIVVEILKLPDLHAEKLKGRQMARVLLQNGRTVNVLSEQLEVINDDMSTI